MSLKNYYYLLAQTLRGLDEARERFSELQTKNPPLTPGERTRIPIEMAELEAAWQKVYQETQAAAHRTVTVAPPSADDLRQSKEIADRLEQMTAKANTVNDVVAATAGIMSIWNKTNPQPKAE
jgi:anaerobic glycerol-3-phosphate dehydrogenase